MCARHLAASKVVIHKQYTLMCIKRMRGCAFDTSSKHVFVESVSLVGQLAKK